jgi:hypothetical protein
MTDGHGVPKKNINGIVVREWDVKILSGRLRETEIVDIHFSAALWGA